MNKNEWFFVKKSLSYLSETVILKDYKRVSLILEKSGKYQKKNVSGTCPSAHVLKAKKKYHLLHYTVWANISWGRYWSWDPKETWALITLLVYSLALHPESLPLFQKPLFFHVFTVLSFLIVLMTYFGVNFALGGMHSYASS